METRLVRHYRAPSNYKSLLECTLRVHFINSASRQVQTISTDLQILNLKCFMATVQRNLNGTSFSLASIFYHRLICADARSDGR
jgi:hypothetical protein